MRVGLDLSVAQISQAGTAVYASNLARALATLKSGPTLSVFKVQHHRDMSAQKTMTSRLQTLHRDLVWMHWSLPQAAKRANIDILHMPANIIPLKSGIPTVVTILDTIVLQNPENFTWWFRNYAKFFLPRAAKTADRIVTISENSKEALIRFLKVPAEKISVTYLAASSEFRPASEQERDAIRHKYRLGRYILTIGTLEPRKNIVRVLRAFSKLLKEDPGLELVHAGPRGWMFESALKEVSRLQIENSVKFLGLVPLSDLPYLYSAAEIFVYPSLYEGFGLPVLEAMSCACPVVTSNTSSIPEITGESAELVDPYSEEDIFNAMQRLREDPQRAHRNVELGLGRANLFSWQRCAAETFRVYEEVLQR